MTSETVNEPHRSRTQGLNHVNLVVRDVTRSRAFYESALGFEYVEAEKGITFLSTPGADDLLGLQQSGGELDRASGKRRTPGEMGGVDHIGFAVDPDALDELVAGLEEAGGSVLMTIGDGPERTVFVTDPDGYVLQLG